MQQETALNILKTGNSVFLTGEPGSGKTHVIMSYIRWLEQCGVKVAVTATTGIAATHIGGMTIHAWSGIGAKDTLTQKDLDSIIAREVVVKRIQKTKVLIIDEISMLSGHTLDMVNRVCKTARHRSEPFGGLQVILVGDFFQLPPIVQQGDVVVYAFESITWKELSPVTCYIHEQYRQEDSLLLELLQSIRRNDVTEEHFSLLQEQTDIRFEHIEPTRLYTHNVDVDTVNLGRLKDLPGPARTFSVVSKGATYVVESLKKSCLSPAVLELKVDAMVMCTKNNFEAGYVNGTLGRVVSFDTEEGYPIIETTSGVQHTIKPASWSVVEDKKILAEIIQIPLRLAWAITIHKSQGMSLDATEIDLSKSFAFGQGYVALSRVRTLGGLKMLGMHPSALRVDPKIVTVDDTFLRESTLAEEAMRSLDEESVRAMQEQFIKAQGGTYRSVEDTTRAAQGRRPKEGKNTYEETKELLQEGLTVFDIAKKREVSESTVWKHVETLVEQDLLSLKDIDGFHKNPLVSLAKQPLVKAMEKHGVEKLKPLFEETNEQFDYNTIRLIRILYILEQKDSA